MNFVEKAIFGMALKVGSKWAVDSIKWLYKKYGGIIDKVEEALLGADDLIEEYVGDVFPGEYQEQYDATIKLAFDTVEKTLTDGAKWRMLMRAVKAGTFEKLVKEQIEALEQVPIYIALERLPAEAKAFLSKLKERLGRAKFRDIWNVFMGEKVSVPEDRVKAGFKKLAEIHNENRPIFERLIEESKKRKAEMI